MTTPIEKLDQAVRDYIAETEEERGELGAWVLTWSEQFIVPVEGHMPLQTSRNMIISPSTTAESAGGLVRYSQLEIDAILRGDYDEVED